MDPTRRGSSQIVRRIPETVNPASSLAANDRYTAQMDRLWTPWRYTYITASSDTRQGVPALLEAWPGEDQHCVFCNMIRAVRWAVDGGMPQEEAERAAWILELGPTCYTCLNAYPYSSGHIMVVPYAHVASLAELPSTTAIELIHTAQRAESAIRAVYRPDGLNFGLNLGQAAGAGVANHLHLHGLPRWIGDTNFMTVVGETRILPETLDVTWQRLRAAFVAGQPKTAERKENVVPERPV